MAARALVIPAGSAGMDLWERFLSLADQYVQEGNFLAGECLWEIGKVPGACSETVIRSTTDPAGFVECSFDPETGVLTCRPGSAIRVDPVSFPLLAAANDAVSQECGACTLEEAISFVLDELVSIEDSRSQANQALEIEGNDLESTAGNLDQTGTSRIPA